jgi:cell division transport system ATP-binding protein
MIELHHVHKIFPNGSRALVDISLHIGRDEFAFIVGPSGAGKSTLLCLLYREEFPTSGEVFIDNINITKLKESQIPYLRRNIGVVFQDYKLLPRRTVYENVAFALRVMEVPRPQIRRKVYQVLELVNLAHKAKCFPTELSGGEQQRLCIARAIVNSPPILLADEPTGNVDPDTSWEIILLLEKINLRQTTVLVATHDKTIVDSMRKRVIALEDGRITRDQQVGGYDRES